MHKLFHDKEEGYWQSKIKSGKRNQEMLRKSFDGLFGNKNTTEDINHSADEFAAFFDNKIKLSRNETVDADPAVFTRNSCPALES